MSKIRGQLDKDFRERADKSLYLAKQKATDFQWERVTFVISMFKRKYPYEWKIWQDDLAYERTKYQLAKPEHKELRKASWRNTASFPVIYREGRIVDGILPRIEKIIPKLTHKDSVNFATFLKKYPEFLPGEKF